MIGLAYFDTTPVEAIASQVVADLLKGLPPEGCEIDSKKAQKDREQAHRRIHRHVESLMAKTPLNIYQKAKLGLHLQDALEAAGYPTGFAKPFAHDVVSHVARAGAR